MSERLFKVSEIEFIQSSPQLFIRQKKEWAEIIVDWETSNNYEVFDSANNSLGRIAERAGGFGHFVKRWFFRSHRAFEIDVFNLAGKSLLHLSRSFFFFFSDLAVTNGAGRKFGNVKRRWGWISKKYDLHDETGQVFARISSPIWKLWTFPVTDNMGRETAVISKKWGGVFREFLTDADTYGIDFSKGQFSESQRAVLFAAAISIDFDFFENNSKDGGLFSFAD